MYVRVCVCSQFRFPCSFLHCNKCCEDKDSDSTGLFVSEKGAVIRLDDIWLSSVALLLLLSLSLDLCALRNEFFDFLKHIQLVVCVREIRVNEWEGEKASNI